MDALEPETVTAGVTAYDNRWSAESVTLGHQCYCALLCPGGCGHHLLVGGLMGL